MSTEPLLDTKSIANEAVASIMKSLDNNDDQTRSRSVQYHPKGLTASKLKEPGAMRRFHLHQVAKSKGISYHVRPLEWKVSFLEKFETLSLMSLTNFGLLRQEYQGEGSSNLMTFFSLIKSMICTAILFLPKGFAYGGWGIGILSVIIVSLICTVCMYWLSEARDRHPGTYEELVGVALGAPGYRFAQFCLMLTQCAFCIVTSVFFNQNFLKIMEFYGVELSLYVPALIQLIVYVPLSLIRELHKLAITHLIGDAIIMMNLLFFFIMGILKVGEEGIATEVQMVNSMTFPLMFGMAIYSFEGIALVLPIKEAMKKKEDFNLLMVLMMVVTAVCLIGFALITYLAFGDNIAQIATLSYQASYTNTSMLLVYLISVAFTFPLLAIPVFLILESFCPDLNVHVFSSIRVVIVVSALALGVLLNDKADKYMSIVGALFCAPVAYIMPSLIHLRTKTDKNALDWILGVGFVVIGVVIGVFCTAMAIINW